MLTGDDDGDGGADCIGIDADKATIVSPSSAARGAGWPSFASSSAVASLGPDGRGMDGSVEVDPLHTVEADTSRFQCHNWDSTEKAYKGRHAALPGSPPTPFSLPLPPRQAAERASAPTHRDVYAPHDGHDTVMEDGCASMGSCKVVLKTVL